MKKKVDPGKKADRKKLLDSVKTRLIAIIIAIMAIPLIISIVISYETSHTEAVENMEAMNVAQANLVEHDFKSIVEQNMQVLRTVANSVSARQLLLGEVDKESVADWLLKTDNEIGDGNSLVISNADGMQIVRSVGDCVDVSDREYFKQCKSTQDFYVSDQIISKSTGQRICTFIHPIFDLDGNFIGAVQRNYNLVDFTGMVKGEVTSKNQDIFIGDNNGDLIGHTSMDLEGGEPVNFSSQQWYTASRSDREASGSYDSHFNGGDWKMSYQREPITGWVTVIATDKGVALANSNRMLMIVIIVGIVMLIIATVLSFMLAKSFTDPIIAINATIRKIAGGEFVRMDKFDKRKDEFGDIVRNTNHLVDTLSDIVKDILGASKTVNDKSKALADTAEQISNTADDVSNAVQEMAKGATEQAGSVEKATENLSVLSDAIQTVADNAQQLAEAAAGMNDASQSSAEALKQLSANMDTMGESVSAVAETMKSTNAAVQSVNDKVDGITSIASQTNLLALNASIEAARAGEAGRGFAVVAEEIGKLATESASTAEEIRNEMQNLLKHSEQASAKTEEISRIGEDVNRVLVETVDKINDLIGDVGSTVDGVNTISGLTQECDASKVVIVDAMSSLSAISEENAASTQETSASMQELNATVNVLAGSAGELSSVADQLDNDLKFFKL